MDSYVQQAEPVADYLTRFSGLTPQDFIETPSHMYTRDTHTEPSRHFSLTHAAHTHTRTRSPPPLLRYRSPSPPPPPPHSCETLKAVYLKLRQLVDAGAIFVGHGLQTDFEIINLVVPPDQARPPPSTRTP